QDSLQGIGKPPCRSRVPVTGPPRYFLAPLRAPLSALKLQQAVPLLPRVTRPNCYPCRRSVTQVTGLDPRKTLVKTAPIATQVTGPFRYPSRRAVPPERRLGRNPPRGRR